MTNNYYEIYQKNEWSLDLQYVDDDMVGQSVVGKNLVFVLKKTDDKRLDDTNALIKKVILLTDTTAHQEGDMSFFLSSAETNLPATEYKFQFNIETTDKSKIETVYYGKLRLIDNIIEQ